MRLGACILLAAFAGIAEAQPLTRIKLSLDWLLQGPTSFLHMARLKGYFREEGLDVTIDVGTGASGSIQRMASGTYDAALGDMSAHIEFLVRNRGPLRFQAVYVQYDQLPAAFFALRKSGIRSIRDFPGQRILDTAGGSGKRILPLLARSAGIDPSSVRWVIVAPELRGRMLVTGAAEALFGFLSIPLELTSLGVKHDEMVTIPIADYGIRYYGNALLVSMKLITHNPKVVAALVRAFNRAFKEALADPATSVKYLKQVEPLISEEVEIERFRMLIPSMLTHSVRTHGLGTIDRRRLEAQIDQVMEAHGLAGLAAPEVEEIFTPRFLPPAVHRMPNSAPSTRHSPSASP
jgi:ABC-type nitrate/sulfonate/bicarbonate transport system substrate-binding protein